MRDYWNSLQPRERIIVTIATLFIAVVVIYLSLIEPFMEERNSLELRIAIQQEDLQWMRENAHQFKGSIGRAGQQPGGGQSLLSYVDRSAKEHALNSAIKRIQPEGQKVRVEFENVSFDRMTDWLSKVESSGYTISGIVVERHTTAGRVNARVIIGSLT